MQRRQPTYCMPPAFSGATWGPQNPADRRPAVLVNPEYSLYLAAGCRSPGGSFPLQGIET
jgi:hypothetical protein